MPIRFRRTLRVAPGVKLNFSKSGVSTTVGPKGFHFTFGKRGVRRSVSIPGTGISEVDYIKKNDTSGDKEEKDSSRQHHARSEKHVSDTDVAPHAPRSRRPEAAMTSAGSLELRNFFVLLGVVIFFFAGAVVLGFLPPHFFSTSLQFLAHLVQSTGH